jgi:hypothetical protein
MMDRRCETCRWWDTSIKLGTDMGLCRRMPPLRIIEGGVTPDGEWPATSNDDWCGEWHGSRMCECGHLTYQL